MGWLLLGCVIPDIPWILRRLAGSLAPDMDAYDLVQYSTVQASLLFCLVLSAGFACLARRPVIVAAILSLNCLGHLLLDAVEIKPGNGVHLFAPWSWKLFNIGWLWPENFTITVLTMLGMGLSLWLMRSQPQQLDLVPDRARLRIFLCVLALVIYLAAPFAFMWGPYNADNHSVRTLREIDQRVGRTVRLDRQRYFAEDGDGGHYLLTYTGEKLRLDGVPLERSGYASVEGVFVAVDMIRVTNIHQNQAVFRNYASIAGLLILSIVWIRTLWKGAN
jgi:hypothetical protein